MRAASGSLPDLDRIATACLRAAARKKRKVVDRDVLARVLKHHDLPVKTVALPA
jgi:general secretion pathway protein A